MILTLTRPDDTETQIDTTQLADDLPVLLYNVNDLGEVVDFDPLDESTVAWFTIYTGSGQELEFMWEDQDEQVQVYIRDLENPV